MKMATQISNVEALYSALAEIHKEVSIKNEQNRLKAQEIHNMRTNVLPHTFEIESQVMVKSHAK